MTDHAESIGIGEAAQILDEEFGDVSVSKLRYLESRGLINPIRTRGGSRRFTHHDMQRLRFIIRSQRQEFLPIDVIAQRLNRGDFDVEESRESHPHTGTEHTILSQQLRPLAIDAHRTGLTHKEFAERCACSPAQREQMRQHGLLAHQDATEIPICEVVHHLIEHGIEPRHLRWLVQSAQRTVSLVNASLPARTETTSVSGAANEEARRQLAAELLTLHVLLIRNALVQ